MDQLETLREYWAAGFVKNMGDEVAAQVGECDLLSELHRLVWEYTDVTVKEE